VTLSGLIFPKAFSWLSFNAGSVTVWSKDAVWLSQVYKSVQSLVIDYERGDVARYELPELFSPVCLARR